MLVQAYLCISDDICDVTILHDKGEEYQHPITPWLLALCDLVLHILIMS